MFKNTFLYFRKHPHFRYEKDSNLVKKSICMMWKLTNGINRYILYRPKAETLEVTPSGTHRYHCTIRSCEIIVLSLFFFISVGITEKLDHLKDLGVGTVWLSPIYKSPMVDNGYDISDFYDIDPSFGTLNDFDKLKARAKDLGQYDIPPPKP